MLRICLVAAVAVALLLGTMDGGPATAQTGCFADYKAKRDAPRARGYSFAAPLRLHYGVIELPADACTPQAAAAEIGRRIGVEGWTLLSVGTIFGSDGLAARENEAAGFFLRY